MENEVIGRVHPAKSRCREKLAARSATTVWLLKIPVLPLSLTLFLPLPQSNPAFPRLPLSLLPLLLLLPRFPLGRQATISLLQFRSLTLAAEVLAFTDFPFVSRKS